MAADEKVDVKVGDHYYRAVEDIRNLVHFAESEKDGVDVRSLE